jgi:NADH dehydrogenase
MYNTYWVRFNHRELSFSEALRNSVTLFEAARKAGVKRIVHISVTNPSEDSTLEYFRGKALVEQALRGFGFSYAILRPALIFGSDGILINNIAWALRRLPVFGVFGDGRYRLRPICVEDLAQLAVREGAGHENHVIDAVGPEVFTYRELVEMIAVSIGKRRPIISVPPDVGYCVAKAIGILKNDVFLTRDEIRGLMANLLYVDSEPTGSTKLSEWLRRNASTLGTHYARELSRRTWKHFSVK